MANEVQWQTGNRRFSHPCSPVSVFAILKSMRFRRISGMVLLMVLACFAVARADEIRLKDGSKISGTIVGFEGGSFKVKTPYGFALVRKDKIAEIIPAEPKKKEAKASEKAPAHRAAHERAAPPPAPVKPAAAKPSSVPAAKAKPVAPAHPVTESKLSAPGQPPSHETDHAELPKPQVSAVQPLVEPPAAPPAPTVIHDDIQGNLYVNYTYGFQMYRPPDWDLIPEARKALPDAVAALGTPDQTTLLVIGRQQAKESLDAHAAATEAALRQIYENYRPISDRRATIAGSPAIERHFRGTVEGHDWSVLLVTFLHGNDVYTLLGMTWADSDLIQLEENVISRTVNSLKFTLPHS